MGKWGRGAIKRQPTAANGTIRQAGVQGRGGRLLDSGWKSQTAEIAQKRSPDTEFFTVSLSTLGSSPDMS